MSNELPVSRQLDEVEKVIEMANQTGTLLGLYKDIETDLRIIKVKIRHIGSEHYQRYYDILVKLNLYRDAAMREQYKLKGIGKQNPKDWCNQFFSKATHSGVYLYNPNSKEKKGSKHES